MPRRRVAVRHCSLDTPRRSLAAPRRGVAARHISPEARRRRVAAPHIGVETSRRSLPAWGRRVAAWHISPEAASRCAATPRGLATPRILGLVKIKIVVHEAEERGYWAEVPAIPGCATQGETFEELLQNLYEAVEACRAVDIEPDELRRFLEDRGSSSAAPS